MKFWYIEIRVMNFYFADECVMDDSIEGKGLSFAEENFGVLECVSLVEFQSVIDS